MASIVGMNPAVVQSVARELSGQAQELAATSRRIDSLVGDAVRVWSGVDAQRFRSQWTSSGRAQTNRASTMLSDMSRLLQQEAQEQLDTSNRLGTAGAAGGPGGGSGAGPGGSNDPDTFVDWFKEHLDDLADWGRMGVKGWKTFVTGPLQIKAFIKAFPFLNAAGSFGLSPAGRQAIDKLAKSFRPLQKLLPGVAPALGVLGGGLSVVFGINEIVSGNDHSGWRDVGDRVSGGLQVVSGVGVAALAIGGAALLATPAGPVIAAVAVVAGVAAAAWELGNLVYDHWDDITGFFSDVGAWIGDRAVDAWNAAGDAAVWVGNRAADAAQWVGDRAVDAWHAAGDAAVWVGERAGDAAQWAGDRIGDAAEWVGDRAADVGRGIAQTTGAVANGIGQGAAAVGNWFGSLF
ncbi:MAG: WXG100 family type VII secretion target [Propionibacteriaceae bacterium]|jgi:uncharacterized protein YukE|nr:WXG100 family type VII secretion target [Propionibacteriaceae bacterium]